MRCARDMTSSLSSTRSEVRRPKLTVPGSSASSGPARNPSAGFRWRASSSATARARQPSQLRRGIEDNLRTLRIDQLAVVNLRLMRDDGPDAFFDDQLAAMISARDDGLIAAIGVSNVTLAHVQHALRSTELACVQNAF